MILRDKFKLKNNKDRVYINCKVIDKEREKTTGVMLKKRK